jgi:hypothetical protein
MPAGSTACMSVGLVWFNAPGDVRVRLVAVAGGFLSVWKPRKALAEAEPGDRPGEQSRDFIGSGELHLASGAMSL